MNFNQRVITDLISLNIFSFSRHGNRVFCQKTRVQYRQYRAISCSFRSLRLQALCTLAIRQNYHACLITTVFS